MMWRLKLIAIALTAAVVAAFCLLEKEGTKADDKEMWKT
jgi:hypothetical protein